MLSANTNFQDRVPLLKLLFLIRFFYKPETLNIDSCGSHRNCIQGANFQYDLSLAFLRGWSLSKNSGCFFFRFSPIISIVFYSPTLFKHSYKLRSVFFPMVPIICKSWLLGLSYGSLLWARHSGRKWRKKVPSPKIKPLFVCFRPAAVWGEYTGPHPGLSVRPALQAQALA
jgi:hypothetical protein